MLNMTYVTNPATNITSGQSGWVRFIPDGSAVIVVNTVSPYLHAYEWTRKGFGNKFSAPPTTPASTITSLSVTQNDIFLGLSGTPHVYACSWSSSGFGSKYSDPSPAIPAVGIGQGVYVAANPDGNSVGFSLSLTSPYHHSIQWTTGVGFGSHYSAPVGLLSPATFGQSAYCYNRTGTFIFRYKTAGLQAIPWNSVTGYGTVMDVTTPVTSRGARSINCHPDGNLLVYTDQSGTFMRVIEFDETTGFGSVFSDPSTTVTGASPNCIMFDPQGEYVVACGKQSATSLFHYGWKWSPSGFGDLLPYPPCSLGFPGNDLDISPFGDVVYITNATPYICGYINRSTIKQTRRTGGRL